MTDSDVLWRVLPAAIVCLAVYAIHALFGLPAVLAFAALVDCGIRGIERHRERQGRTPASAEER